MTRGELCQMLEKVAISYRLDCKNSIVRSSHMNKYNGEEIQQETIDAILVDFINKVALFQGIDLGLYTFDIDGSGREPANVICPHCNDKALGEYLNYNKQV